MSDKNPDDIGALWAKESARGQYMTGTVNGERIVVFPNTHKTPGSKQPDYRILKAKSKEERAESPIGGQALAADDIPF